MLLYMSGKLGLITLLSFPQTPTSTCTMAMYKPSTISHRTAMVLFIGWWPISTCACKCRCISITVNTDLISQLRGTSHPSPRCPYCGAQSRRTRRLGGLLWFQQPIHKLSIVCCPFPYFPLVWALTYSVNIGVIPTLNCSVDLLCQVFNIILFCLPILHDLVF